MFNPKPHIHPDHQVFHLTFPHLLIMSSSRVGRRSGKPDDRDEHPYQWFFAAIGSIADYAKHHLPDPDTPFFPTDIMETIEGLIVDTICYFEMIYFEQLALVDMGPPMRVVPFHKDLPLHVPGSDYAANIAQNYFRAKSFHENHTDRQPLREFAETLDDYLTFLKRFDVRTARLFRRN